jgi:hypothetical protein
MLFIIFKGDYGLSREQGISMTIGVGTEFIFYFIFFFFMLYRGCQAPEVMDGRKYE